MPGTFRKPIKGTYFSLYHTQEKFHGNEWNRFWNYHTTLLRQRVDDNHTFQNGGWVSFSYFPFFIVI